MALAGHPANKGQRHDIYPRCPTPPPADFLFTRLCWSAKSSNFSNASGLTPFFVSVIAVFLQRNYYYQRDPAETLNCVAWRGCVWKARRREIICEMELFCHTDGVTLFVSRRCNLRAGTILCQLRLASAYTALSVNSKPFKWEVLSLWRGRWLCYGNITRTI